MTPFSSHITLEPSDNQRLANLCGVLDAHLRQIERHMDVVISNRGNAFQVTGTKHAVRVTEQVIQEMYAYTKKQALSGEQVDLLLHDLAIEGDPQGSEIKIKARHGFIYGRSPNQRCYLQGIRQADINFGIGPAGTGKTYLAVACAIAALETGRARRLVLVRPAVEAGERLGFLPGDMTQKVDPYLRPLYDALYEMLGFGQVTRYIEQNVIEVVPLAFMRGRTLSESFVILDEAQNTTVKQMKMFLTRIGFSSKTVVTGDITQIDLPSGTESGLKHVVNVLQDEDRIHFTFFQNQDVVRHPLVAQILDAYQKYEVRGSKQGNTS